MKTILNSKNHFKVAFGSQHWMDPDAVEAYALEREFKFAPVLYKGPYNKELAYSLTSGPSVFCRKELVREGIVIKKASEYSKDGVKQALKWINESYLDNKNNTDFH